MDRLDYNGKLIISTCYYKCQAYSAYCASLAGTVLLLERLGVNFDIWPNSGDFYITRAFNQLLSTFVEDPDATDFLNIDSDQSWNPEGVIRFLLRPEEILAGSYRCTNAWNNYVGVIVRDEDNTPLGKLIDEDTAILKAQRLPAGFLRLKKEPLQKYIEAYPEDYFWVGDTKTYRFFWDEVEDHQFISMDYRFADKMRALGYDLWIYPDINISHWGLTEHKGNLDQHLRAVKAIKDVKDMKDGIWSVQGD